MIASLLFQTFYLISILGCCHSQLERFSSCAQNSIRLQDGRNDQEGRLELCGSGLWGTVCNDGWNASSTSVACRQLGFGDRGYAIVGYPVSSAAIYLSEVQCSGVEMSLSQCQIGRRTTSINCNHNEDVQLVCLPPDIPAECESGEIRLVGDSSPLSGQLEVCVGGVWGSVCIDSNADNLPSSAMIVCGQIGINYTKAFASGGAPGDGPIFLRDLQCSGNERSVLDCQADNTIPYDHCRHREDLSIFCYNISKPECSDGEVRLIDGPSSLEGRLEVCQDGIWGSVCDDGWTDENSMVVCKQLGVNAVSARIGRYGLNSSPYFLNEVKCSGDEESILNCTSFVYPSLRTMQCTESEAVGIVCITSNEIECTAGEIRLVDSSGSPVLTSSGIVEVCHEGLWTLLCTRLWGLYEAHAICNDLSMPTSGVIGYLEQNTTITGPLATVRCPGIPETLSTCNILPSECQQPGYGAVMCGPPATPACSDGDIQLIDGESSNEGLLETCYLGTWGTVCDDSWTIINSMVACRQLGLETERATFVSRSLDGGGSGPIFIDDLECLGSEDNLTLCKAINKLNNHDCVHFEDVLLFCPNPSQSAEESSGENDNGLSSILQVVLPILVVFMVGITIAVIVIVAIAKKMKLKRVNLLSPAINMRGGTMTNLIPEEERQRTSNIYEASSSLTETRGRRSHVVIHSNKPNITSLLSSEIRISKKDIHLLSKIGEGEFGVVYKASLSRNMTSSEIVAVKTLKGLYSQEEVRQILEEAKKAETFFSSECSQLDGSMCCRMSCTILGYSFHGQWQLTNIFKERKEDYSSPRTGR